MCFSVDCRNSIRIGLMTILKVPSCSFFICRWTSLPIEYPPLSTSSSMDEIGGSEILHISSSLSTPNKAISSGIGMFVIRQVTEMNRACASSQQNKATGLGSSCSHWLTSILISSSCLSDSKLKKSPPIRFTS